MINDGGIQMFKKLGAALLAASLCVSVCALPAAAAQTQKAAVPTVSLNGLTLPGSTTISVGSETCLPIRALFEAMGYEVNWSRENDIEQVSVSAADDSITDVKTFNVTTGECTDNGSSRDLDAGQFLSRSEGRLYISTDLVSALYPLAVRTGSAGTSVDTVAENSLTLKRTTLANKAAHLEQSASYPVVSGLTNAAAQTAINAALKAAVEQSFKNGQDAEANNSDARKSGENLPDSETKFSGSVVYNQNGLLTVCFDEYQYMGGAHGTTTRSAKTFDLITGKELAVSALFSDWAGAKKILNAYIGSRFDPASAIAAFSSLTDDDCIFPTNNGLTVCFQEYEYFPYAAGIVRYTIPWSELKASLAPAYTVLAAVPAALDAAKTNALTVGQTANFVLTSNATTGYSWHLSSSDEKVVSALADYYVVDQANAGLAGRGAVGETFTVRANAKGTATLTLKYYRDWEGAGSAAETVTYKITVS